jgi:TolA-binding protein
MRLFPVSPRLIVWACLLLGLGAPATAQTVDPAILGERLQRVLAVVESLEVTVANQQRQIESLGNEVQRLRDDLSQQGQNRAWTTDIKRLGDAVSEVDRKRLADQEQVLKVLNDLKKSVTAAVDAPTRAPSRPATTPSTSASTSGTATPPKALPINVERGQTISDLVRAFNEQASRQGVRPLTITEVMKFNNITDARRVQEGQSVLLPMYPQ